ncbi:MAG: BON domain-containing protein [Burkholderiaceae bacterium]
MTKSRYFQAVILTATTLALTACVAPDRVRYDGTVPYSGQTGAATTTNPTYYRGTESGMATTNNDASINANVMNAVSSVQGLRASNIQVTTLNGNVSLRGIADNQMVAQSAVQAARQVSGVQRVDYDLRLLQP